MAFVQQTAFNRTETTASGNENAFTRANIFGLFLTLAFVLLVQPFGSLVYAKPKSPVGRTIFFFWRLNPLACALEVLSLIIALIHGIFTAVKSKRHAPGNQLRFHENLQVTAVAVTLLRRHGRLPDHWVAFANSQRTSAPSQQGGGESTFPISYTDDSSPVSNSNVRRDHLSNPSSPLPRTERPAHVEAGEGDDAEGDVMRDIDSRFSDTACGRNFLSHAEHVIDVVSTLAVVLVVVKLAAVTVPIHVCIPAWFMIASWAAAQVLLFARPRGEITSTDHVIRHVIELERVLNHPVTWATFGLLFSPLFGYFTSVMFFKTHTIQVTWRLGLHCLIVSYGCVANPWFFYDMILNSFVPSCISRRGNRPCEQGLSCLSELRSKPKAIISSAILPTVFFLVGFVVGGLWGLCILQCVYETDPSWQWTILPFTIYPSLMGLWFFLPAIPFMREGKWTEWVKGTSLFFNLAITICFFTGAMIMYDDTDSYKPEWVEWLGRLEKWRRLFQGDL